MKNTIIILFAFTISICFGRNIEKRTSFSDTKQVAVEKKQGGTLLRFDHASLGDSAWQCTELFVPPNTATEELQAFVSYHFPLLKAADQTKLFADYGKNAITKTSLGNLNEAAAKIADLDNVVKILQSKVTVLESKQTESIAPK